MPKAVRNLGNSIASQTSPAQMTIHISMGAAYAH
jgi:hypothetical protein